MPTIDLPHGKLRYRAAGPEDSKRPPVVFIHGFLVSNTLWSKTADALAEVGIRSYAPDLPSAPTPFPSTIPPTRPRAELPAASSHSSRRWASMT